MAHARGSGPKAGLIRIRAKTIDGQFWQPKTGRNRSVPISTALAAVLDKYKPSAAGPWLLPSPEGVRWDPDNFSHKLADENAKAKLPWTCLDFRHTFGSMLAQRGISLYKISAMMGNSPEICRRHYAALHPGPVCRRREFRRRAQCVKAERATARTDRFVMAKEHPDFPRLLEAMKVAAGRAQPWAGNIFAPRRRNGPPARKCSPALGA